LDGRAGQRFQLRPIGLADLDFRQKHNVESFPGRRHRVDDASVDFQYMDPLGQSGSWTLVVIQAAGHVCRIHLGHQIDIAPGVTAALGQAAGEPQRLDSGILAKRVGQAVQQGGLGGRHARRSATAQRRAARALATTGASFAVMT
jgi:hypothetical protein